MLDKGSDGYNKAIRGLCNNCMILKAAYDLADKNGKRLDLSDGVYIHHIVMMDRTGKSPSGGGIAPSFNCKGTGKGFGKGFGASPKGGMGMARHAGSIADAFGAPDQIPGFGAAMIAKGHEMDDILYAAPNSTIKSGFWVGPKDGMFAQIEAINYRNTPRDVYLSIDAEFLPMDKRPDDYLHVALGMMTAASCSQGTALTFRTFFFLFLHQLMSHLDPPTDKPITYKSDPMAMRGEGYILNICKILKSDAML